MRTLHIFARKWVRGSVAFEQKVTGLRSTFLQRLKDEFTSEQFAEAFRESADTVGAHAELHRRSAGFSRRKQALRL